MGHTWEISKIAASGPITNVYVKPSRWMTGGRGVGGGGEGFRCMLQRELPYPPKSTLCPSFFPNREATGFLARIGKRANPKAASASYGRTVRTVDAIPTAVLHVATSAGEVEFRTKARRCKEKLATWACRLLRPRSMIARPWRTPWLSAFARRTKIEDRGAKTTTRKNNWFSSGPSRGTLHYAELKMMEMLIWALHLRKSRKQN